MNEEEISVFRWNTETKEFYVLEHKFDGVNSIEDFINYIHNLDKENKQLKENNMSMQEEMVRTWKKLDDLEQIEQEHQKINGELREENKKYKEVIDKATNELFILKDMIYKPETREENFEIQRKISSIIKRLNGKEVSK